MSLVNRLKSVLGLNGTRERDVDEPAAVTVEHEPATTTEEPPRVEEEPGDASAEHEEPTEPEPEPAAVTEGDDGDVVDISGVGPSYASRLEEAGIGSVAELADASAADLATETGISEKRIERWIEQAREMSATG